MLPARQRIYWIQDNLSANWTPDIRGFAATNNIELVATPTYASYLNPVESHFSAISQFVVRNADYPNRESFAFAAAPHHLPQRRPPPHRRRSPPPHRRMTFPGKTSEKVH